MNDYLLGTDVLGEEISFAPLVNCVRRGEAFSRFADASAILGDLVGVYDVQESQRRFNTIRQMTVGMARTILKGGEGAINGAIAAAVKKPHLASYFLLPVAIAEIVEVMENGALLPGGGERKNCFWKLKWHEEKISKLKSDGEIYPYGDDLKKWTQQAFIEANAVEEGSAYAAQVYAQMWGDIAENIRNLPADLREKVSQGVSWLTGIPTWAWGLGGIAILGLVGVAGYKILVAATPTVARYYLPSSGK